jgi:hypothetical protein
VLLIAGKPGDQAVHSVFSVPELLHWPIVTRPKSNPVFGSIGFQPISTSSVATGSEGVLVDLAVVSESTNCFML